MCKCVLSFWNFVLFLILSTLILNSCGNDRPKSYSEWLDFENSYRGVLPCADCEGIDYTLNLFADSTYYMKFDYLGKERSFYQWGKWLLSSNQKILILDNGSILNEMYAIKSKGELKKLHRNGLEMVTTLNYSLKTDASKGFTAFYPEGLFRGEFVYFADAPIYYDCNLGKKFPVRMEADYSQLERTYSEYSKEPGDRQYVKFKGGIVPKSEENGSSLPEEIIIDEFQGLAPEKSCSPFAYPKSINAVSWKITHLYGGELERTVEMDPKLIPSLYITKAGRASGSDGCNRFSGAVSIDGNKIEFDELATTKMACMGVNYDAIYIKALGEAHHYIMLGKILNLYNEENELILQYQI